MDRSGVLIVMVGCLFLAAGGALMMLKNANVDDDASLHADEHQAQTAPTPNLEVAPAAPLIERIEPTPPEPPVSPTEPNDNVDHITGTATATGATTVSGRADPGNTVVAGNVGNAQSVVAGMSAGFRRCYNRGLQTAPNMQGSLRITARIGKNGEVVLASAAGGTGLSKDVIECVVNRVKSAQFDPPTGGGAVVVIPVSFQNQ